jgi:hypothetical protein
MQTEGEPAVNSFEIARSWFPNSSFGTNPATKLRFGFPFVSPVISDETEFQEAKHSQTEFGNERKSARGRRAPRFFATCEAASNVAATFGVRESSATFPFRDEVDNAIKPSLE